MSVLHDAMSPNLWSRHVRTSFASARDCVSELKKEPSRRSGTVGLNKNASISTKQLCFALASFSERCHHPTSGVVPFIASQVCFPLPLPNQAGTVALLVRNPRTKGYPNQAGHVALLVGTCFFIASLLCRKRAAASLLSLPTKRAEWHCWLGFPTKRAPLS